MNRAVRQFHRRVSILFTLSVARDLRDDEHRVRTAGPGAPQRC
jgi:hypothetical protein